MARYFGNKKSYTKRLARKFGIIFFAVLLVLGLFSFFLLKVQHASWLLVGLAFVLIWFFVQIADILNIRSGKVDRGIGGEKSIKNILMSLSDEYMIFQNVPIKKNLDADLVVLGPTGVFAIEAKSHKRFTLRADGKDFIHETMTEAMSLKEYLGKSGINVYVNAALVFSRAFVPQQLPQSGVSIISEKFLISLLERGRRVEFDQAKTEQTIKKLYNV